MKKVLITGATGFVGKKLIEHLYQVGVQEINIFTRDPNKTNFEFPVNVFKWSPNKHECDEMAFNNVDTIFNLAGESIAEGRWTEDKKKRILDSRINSGLTLLKFLKRKNNSVTKVISASAIGIYGNSEKLVNEDSPQSNDFLSQVCQEWENVFHREEIEGIHFTSLRVGIVLGHGGALQKMLPPFKAGAGGILGDGKQFMSWVHIDDLVNMFIFVGKNNFKHKVFNAVSPEPITNNGFTKCLGQVLKRPTIFPVPKMALKVIFGEMSQILLEGQRVSSKRITDKGFQFKFSKLSDALNNLLQNKFTKKKYYQLVEKPTNEIFSFFVNEKNLEKITPKEMKFQVKKMSTDFIQKGTLITYGLHKYFLPMKWVSRISDFKINKYFIDEQVKGPYKSWVHKHSFIDLGGKTLIVDEIAYKLPFGKIGSFFGSFFVKKEIDQIFSYRKNKLNELLG